MSAGGWTGPAHQLWIDGHLKPAGATDSADDQLMAADSWLVEDGRTLGLELHRQRFERAVVGRVGIADAAGFWHAAIGSIPAHGTWFPRVELTGGHSPRLGILLRAAPQRRRTAMLATAAGPDRRTRPLVKGPDLAAMARLRAEVAVRGADEAVILSPEGFVVEGAYSAILWWRGETLCFPVNEFARIPSVTAATLLTLATALGVETADEAATPDDLDGLEIWVLSSLHGIRIATGWIDGPTTAEEPGRLAVWRERLGRLSRPVATLA